ncbi:carbonic anhydrase-related protein 10-like isoform X2 [Oratosquilla oratoria]
MCSEGRRQSPINLDPRTLLHDPNLTPVSIDKSTVDGTLVNTGHSVEWRVDQSKGSVNISGGPLSYTYTVTHLRIHFGEREAQGSEHTLANQAFPAELQIYGYNSQLYRNFSQASNQVYGVAAVAILIRLQHSSSPALTNLMEGIEKVKFGGSSVTGGSLIVSELIPNTVQYLTYDGSLTEPGCHETVTWIVPNKPIYISFTDICRLRELRQGSSPIHRHSQLANNFRPIQSSHHRTVRTNIDYSSSPHEDGEEKKCYLSEARFHYKANEMFLS